MGLYLILHQGQRSLRWWVQIPNILRFLLTPISSWKFWHFPSQMRPDLTLFFSMLDLLPLFSLFFFLSLSLSRSLLHHLCFSATCVSEPFISGWEKIWVDLASEGESHFPLGTRKISFCVFSPELWGRATPFFLSRGQRRLKKKKKKKT